MWTSGTRQEFSNMFERPILNGQCVDSTPQDVQLMRYRSHVLHSLLEGFVQRWDSWHSQLLPQKQDLHCLKRVIDKTKVPLFIFNNTYWLELVFILGEVMTSWRTSCPLKRNMCSWCVCPPCRGRSTQSSWTASGRQETQAGLASTRWRLSVSAARWGKGSVYVNRYLNSVLSAIRELKSIKINSTKVI